MSELPILAVLRRLLIVTAEERRLITYQALAAQAGVPGPGRIHRLTQMLETLLAEDHAAGRPLLAALVVSKLSPGLPRRGFFACLERLGRYRGPEEGSEAAAFWRSECQAAWEYWGNQPFPPSEAGKGGGCQPAPEPAKLAPAKRGQNE